MFSRSLCVVMVMCSCFYVLCGMLACYHEIHDALNAADDETRVKLKGLSHDYINANYVNVRLGGLLHSVKCCLVIGCFVTALEWCTQWLSGL